jgi:ribonuclease-3
MTENPDPTRETSLDAVERALGHKFRDRRLLAQALTHPSAKSLGSETEDNQKLEFLGDALLNFLLAEMLFHAFPLEGEGIYTKARALLNSRRHFASLGRRLALGAALKMPPKVGRLAARDRDGALADAFEAVLAALFLDAGLEAARAAARRLFAEDIASLDLGTLLERDSKSALQERASAMGLPEPAYRLVERGGPDHEPYFVWEVACGRDWRASGKGLSKKAAQQEAARSLFERLSGSGPP